MEPIKYYGISKFFDKNLVQPLMGFLKQGLTPEKLSLCVAFGLTLGTFPVIGSTTLICTAAALIFRLNMPAIQLINYFAYPLQLLLFVPFFRLGEYLFFQTPIPLDLTQLFTSLQTDMIGTIQSLWWANVRAMVAWSILAVPTGLILYFFFVSIFSRITKDYKNIQ